MRQQNSTPEEPRVATGFPFDPATDHQNPFLQRWRNRCNYLNYGGTSKWIVGFFKYMRGVAGNFTLLALPIVLVSFLIVLSMVFKHWIGLSTPFLFTLTVSLVTIFAFVLSLFFEEIPSAPSQRRKSRQKTISIITALLPFAIVADIVPFLIHWLRSIEVLTDTINWNSIFQYGFTFVLIYGSSGLIALKTFANTPTKYKLAVKLLAFMTSWIIVASVIIWLINRMYYGIPPTGPALLLPFTIVFAIAFAIIYYCMEKTRYSACFAIALSILPCVLLAWVMIIPYSQYITSNSKKIGELTRPISGIVNAIKEDEDSLERSLSPTAFKILDTLGRKWDYLAANNLLTWKEHYDSDYPILTRKLEEFTPYLHAPEKDAKLLQIAAKSGDLQDWSVFTTIRPKYYAAAMSYLEAFGNINNLNQVDKQLVKESQSLFAMRRLVKQSKIVNNDLNSVSDFKRRAMRTMLLGKMISKFYTKNLEMPFILDMHFLTTFKKGVELLGNDIEKSDLSMWIKDKLLIYPIEKGDSGRCVFIDPPTRKLWMDRLFDKMKKESKTCVEIEYCNSLAEMLVNSNEPNAEKNRVCIDDDLVLTAFIELLSVLSVRENNTDNNGYFNLQSGASDSVKGLLSKFRSINCIANFNNECGFEALSLFGETQRDWDELVKEPGDFLSSIIVREFKLAEQEKQQNLNLNEHLDRIEMIMWRNLCFKPSDGQKEFLDKYCKRDEGSRKSIVSICEFILIHRSIGGVLEADPYEFETTCFLRELFNPTIPNSVQFGEGNAHENERSMILLRKLFSGQKAITPYDQERLIHLLLCEPVSGKTERLIRRLFCGEQSDLVSTQRLEDHLAVSMLIPNFLTVVMPSIALFVFGAVFVNPNITSLHQFYKDSLVQAFFMSPDFASSRELDGRDYFDVRVSQCCNYKDGSVAPYLIVNSTLNAQGSRDESLRDRNAYLFVFTPCHMGAVLGTTNANNGLVRQREVFISMEDYEKFDTGFSLGNAMTISAGAASPNMGRYSNWMVRLAMLFSNVRLGYWIWRLDRIKVGQQPIAIRSLAEIFESENRSVIARRLNARLSEYNDRPIAAAFSGGGIRSAAFNLGIAQSCERFGVWKLFDYLSTVSGGGYTGCSISVLMSGQSNPRSQGEKIDASSQCFSTDVDKKDIASSSSFSFIDYVFFDRKYSCVFSEAFAIMDTSHGWWNLSDGGHLENLGVYSLLLRRCKVIVAGDGEDDHHDKFDGLTRMLLLAQNDLGVKIEFADGAFEKLRLDQGFTKSHFAVGKITYPADKDRKLPEEGGWLLYLRSSVDGDEDPIISNYRKGQGRERFPNETTADQFFDEHQFEAYRRLGLHIGDIAFRALFVGDRFDQAQNPGDMFSVKLENYFWKIKTGDSDGSRASL